MYQSLIENAMKDPAIVKDNFQWNLNHGMYYLSLCQIHISGSIGVLLKSKDPVDQKVARRLYKAISEINEVYKVGEGHMDFEKYGNQLEKIINIVSMVIDRIDHLGPIAGFLQNDKNFKKRTPKVLNNS